MIRLAILLGLLVAGELVGSAIRSHPQWLGPAVEAIEALPEAAPLLGEVEREGRVRLSAVRRAGFAAYWQGGNRTIVINTAYSRSEGRLISSIVFELCNAAADRRLQQLWSRAARGRIGRQSFVRAVERIEFDNLQRSAAILRAGVRRGLFPSDTRYWAPDNFERYLRSQQAMGHSQFLARQYDAARLLPSLPAADHMIVDQA